MNTQNESTSVSLAVIHELRKHVEQLTAHLSREEKLQSRQIRDYVKTLASIQMSESQLRRLQQMHILDPEQDERGYYLYSRSDLRDLMVIMLLRQRYNTKYANIGGLLLAEEKQRARERERIEGVREIPVAQDQSHRAKLFWNSHIALILLAWIFDGDVPRYARISAQAWQTTSNNKGINENALEIASCDFLEIEGDLSNPTHNEITLIVATDREVRPKAISWEEWKYCQKQGFKWYALEACSTELSTEYRIIVSVPKESGTRPNILNRSNQEVGFGQEEITLILGLLKCFFLIPTGINTPKQDTSKFSTRLDVLVDLIPNFSRHWQYCAVMIPDSMLEQLVVISRSEGFPDSIPHDIKIPIGQLMCGWTFKNCQSLVVQQANNDEDPRIFYQTNEKAIAAGAFPTSTKYGVPNGVLYVGLQNEIESSESVFSHSEIKILRILGQILGELIELEHMKMLTADNALRIIEEPYRQPLSWDQFGRDVEVLVHRLATHSQHKRNSNLHIMVVSFANFEDIKEKSSEIADWSYAQLQSAAYHHYLDGNLAIPKLYHYSTNQFALLIEDIQFTDEDEKILREVLRKRLNSLSLFFEWGRPPISVECELWSTPYRRSVLAQRIEEKEEAGVVKELITKTEQSFRVLRFLNQAHQHEADGAWAKALGLYERARTLDPANIYIKRHVAKACTKLGDYNTATKWWLLIIEEEKHPSHYRRLAYNLACNGELDEAERMCRKAIKLDHKDASSYAELGNILYNRGCYDDAIECFQKALLLDPERNTIYLIRIAELRFLNGHFRHALTTCTQAQAEDPKNSMVSFWIMKIRQAIEDESSKTQVKS